MLLRGPAEKITVVIAVLVWIATFVVLQQVHIFVDIELTQLDRVLLAAFAACIVAYAMLTIAGYKPYDAKAALATVRAMGWTGIWWGRRFHLLGSVRRGHRITSTACGKQFPVARIHIGPIDRAPNGLHVCKDCLRASAWTDVPTVV